MRQILKKLRDDFFREIETDRISLIEILAESMSCGPKIPSRKSRLKKADRGKILGSLENGGVLEKILGSGPEILGYIYESLQETDSDRSKNKQTTRRKGGVFYTPGYITEFLVKSANDSILPALKKSPPRIHDPACGGGAFLIASFRMLAKKYPSEFEDGNLPLNFITGTDLDPDAVHVSRIALWLESGCSKSAWKILKKNIRVADSLKSINSKKSDQYEIVVANPPYRNVKRGIDPETVEFCRENYRSAKGQWDIAAPFVELALDRLLIPGGAMAYIVPNPILLAENYQSIREIILENSPIMFGPAGQPFEDPGVEASLLVVRKGKSSKRKITILDGSGKKINKNRQIDVNLLPRLPFRIFSHLADDSLIPIFNSLDSGKLVRLGDLVKFTRGIECGKQDKRVIKESPDIKSGFPLIAGESLKPFHVIPAHRFAAPSDRAGYRDLKAGGLWSGKHQLLLRRVADMPISAVAAPPSLVLNTIYVVQPLETIDMDPWSASALFNSSFFRDLFRKIFAFDDSLFPYLRTSQLSRVPVPPSALTDPELSRWSSILHKLASDDNENLDTGGAKLLLERIDKHVENSYAGRI